MDAIKYLKTLHRMCNALSAANVSMEKEVDLILAESGRTPIRRRPLLLPKSGLPNIQSRPGKVSF